MECICKEKGWPIAKWVGSREKHADGTHHVHIGVHFVKRPNIKDSRVFDFPGCEVEGCCPDEGEPDVDQFCHMLVCRGLGLPAAVVQFPDYVSAYCEFVPNVKVLRVWATAKDLSEP